MGNFELQIIYFMQSKEKETEKEKGPIFVIALGGNALLDSKSKGTIEERESAAETTAKQLMEIINSDYNIIITHGNGPQVGNVLIQNEEAADKVPALPLDVCVAETQGEIGYILQKALKNELDARNIKKNIVTILTEVVVNENDPAFSNYTKPVGPYYTKEQKNEIIKKKPNWHFIADPSGNGYRRVVPSPKPIKILQDSIIKNIANKDNIIIAVGGGGIPVYYNNEKKKYEGLEAVIDKDLASARLAIDIEADKFIILTNVEYCYLNFNKPNQITLKEMNLDEATTYLEQGQFSSGSMGPKVQAAIDFILATGKEAIISKLENLQDAIKGRIGTRIYI